MKEVVSKNLTAAALAVHGKTIDCNMENLCYLIASKLSNLDSNKYLSQLTFDTAQWIPQVYL